MHVRRTIGRALRLELIAGLGIALALPTLAFSAQGKISLSTQTTLSSQISDVDAHTRATLSVSVAGEDGQPATGAVVIKDGTREIAGVTLDAQGHATATVELTAGAHNLTADYKGDATHLASAAVADPISAAASTTPDFTVSVAPASLSLTAGQSGSLIVSVTPVNASSLTAPMFVTLSCSAMPDQSSCTFTPQNVEILPSATADVTSSVVVATQAGSAAQAKLAGGTNKVALAILLPGSLALLGLAFGARRRRWLSRLALIALVGFVTMLGATACNPLYNYENHGPTQNLPTPSGTYTVKISAQTSNGVTATTHSTTFALTVK